MKGWICGNIYIYIGIFNLEDKYEILDCTDGRNN